MFHIFYVNRGYMLVLEPPALGSVYDLQKCIFGSINVDINEQYLFLSGGASINRNAMLSAISDVGTDTNPIFLVRRITNAQSESAKTNADGINDIYQDWEISMDRMLGIVPTNSPSAISECVDLGKKCAQLAESIARFCNNVLTEHQFLYQGWMSVISNLDENILRIQRRLDKSIGQAEKLDTYRQKGRSLLDGFDKILDILKKIVLPSSLSPAHSSSNLSDSDGSAEEVTLFDWISSKDPAYSLNSFSQHVLDHLAKTTDEELREAQHLLAMVQDVAQKPQYRDIRGIDKRLSTLNAHLLKLEGNVSEVRETTGAIVQPIIQDGTQNVVVGQRNKLKELKGKLSEQRNCALSFISSKEEVIQNICQRLATWIKQAYQRLQDVDKRVMCFDQKFNGLRQRMDLARQITETPSIYMTAVPEVIRREALKKEFSAWINLHIGKTTEFVTEENKIRQQFYAKLEKHFLRQLFPGMDEIMPQFAPQIAPKIDEMLPKVPFFHLHELRNRFPDMKELLIVGTPRLFSRLAISDPTSPIAPVRSIRRDESFYVRDKTSNIDAMNRNFPSTNWLSEENMGFSPSPSGGANFMSMEQKGIDFTTSTSSIGSTLELQSPRELGPLGEHFDTITKQKSESVGEDRNKLQLNRSSLSPRQPSAPIAIPSNSQSVALDPLESLGSNQFSTPDDTFGSLGSTCGSRFVNVQQIHQSASPKIVRPKSMLPDQGYAQFAHNKQEEEKQFKRLEEVGGKECILTNREFYSKLANTQKSLKQFSEELSSIRHNVKEFDKIFDGLQSSEFTRCFDNYFSDKFSALVELQQKTLEENNKKKIEEIEQQFQNRIEDLTNELEKERSLFMDRENTIKEQNVTICHLKEDLDVMMKERDELLGKVKVDIEQNQQQKEMGETREETVDMTQSIVQGLSEVISHSVIEEVTNIDKMPMPAISSASDEDEGVAKLSSRSCGTQTKIRCKELQTFISLNELYEGCGALIIWNSQLNAYAARNVLFPNSPYIVKDSSFEKLGIHRPLRPTAVQSTSDVTSSALSPISMPPRAWMFVLVESIEMCQIRKATNRYNLPQDTRFYRISVVPIPGDFGTAAQPRHCV